MTIAKQHQVKKPLKFSVEKFLDTLKDNSATNGAESEGKSKVLTRSRKLRSSGRPWIKSLEAE